MNGLNFDGEEEIAPGVKAFRFATPDGRRYYERDPVKAMNLGMPPPNFANANAGAPPVKPPDARLASNAHAQEQSSDVAPPPMAPQVEQQQAQQPDPREQLSALDKSLPLPQRYKRAAAREAGYKPQSMQVSGADPEAIQGLADQYDALDERRAQVAEAQLAAAEEVAANERLNARVQQMEAADKIAAQERVVQLKEQDKRRHMAMLDAEEQKLAQRSPDNERIFKQRGTGTYILTALMRGLGELGAALRRDGRNGTAELIDRRIDMDIQEQEAEIAADKDAIAKRKNAYASLLADGLDPEFAREKLRWMQGLQAEAIAREAAAETGSQQARARYLQQADERAAENLEFKKGLLDKQNVKIDSKYDAGSAGGLYEDPQYYDKLEKVVKARNTIRAEASGTTPGAYEAGKKAESEGQAKEAAGLTEGSKSYQSKLQEAGAVKDEETIAGIRQVLSDMRTNGINELPTIETRNVLSRAVRSTADFVGGSGSGSALMGDSPDETRNRNAFLQAKNQVKNALFGAAQSTQEMENFERSMENVNSLDGLEPYLKILEDKLATKKAAVAAGFNPRDVEKYERRLRDYNPSKPVVDWQK